MVDTTNPGYVPYIIKRFCADWDDWDECEDSSGPLLVLTNPQLAIDLGSHKRGDYVDDMIINLYNGEVTISKNGLETFEFTIEILTEDEF